MLRLLDGQIFTRARVEDARVVMDFDLGGVLSFALEGERILDGDVFHLSNADEGIILAYHQDGRIEPSETSVCVAGEIVTR